MSISVGTSLRAALLMAGGCMLLACAKRSDVRNNQIKIIQPYFHAGTWVFDDPATGLNKEPFVDGIPEMIDSLVADIPDARQGFRLTFSAQEFPGYEIKLLRDRPSGGGYYYRDFRTNSEGWLCPALFKYFQEAPEQLFAKADPSR